MRFFRLFLLSAGLWLAAGCTLDLQEDPNAVQPSQSLPSLTLNSIQRNLAGYFHTISSNGGALTRQQNVGSAQYNTIFLPTSFNGTWSTAYATIMTDCYLLIEQADASGLARHAGMARVMMAYVLTTLVDQFGDVPFSEAFLGSENFNPKADDGASVYAEVFAMLDKAIQDLTTPTVAAGGYLNATAPAIEDLYYANNYSRWVKLANTLKLRNYLNLRLVDPAGAAAGIAAVLTAPGGIITTQTENFVFRYGTNLADPDSRHPRFVANYPSGGGNYMSNWLMWQMFHGYDRHLLSSPSQGDPRMRFYFYRQTNANNSDPNNIRCVTGTVPSHYPQSTGTAIIYNPTAGPPPGITTDPASAAWGRTFCYPTNIGYWGRDHVNPEGIPPDNFLRTAWGVYPSGGRFDANVNGSVNANVGMKGAGFQPIMMRSFVQFMLAEYHLYLGAGAAAAQPFFDLGMDYSFTDVRDWSVNGTFGIGTASPGEGSLIGTFYPAGTYSADVTAYRASANAAYDAAELVSPDEVMNYIAREYWIASYCNGAESYNLYRRTGLPSGMQPALSPSPGEFIRSYWYPADFVNLNKNIEQKELTDRVFWDSNSSNLSF
jgi:hypothetical protein